MKPFTFCQNNPSLSLKNQKKALTRTSSQSSIDSESSDEQTSPLTQISPQAVSSQCHHNKSNGPIPPPPKVVIPRPDPYVSLPSSKSTSEERSSEESDEVPHTKVNPERFSRWLFRSESPIQPSPTRKIPTF
ncbi:hypothetical protein O181_053113 [Austropuccinia psidii MF-1]|uniref:Uncharacterized protein n=1 Tax=Austropuccinia psidii MF-1 TaxID=1389203 RepID=A0A9Q3HQ35_9BASI|nr:hypothetical protein [Austropuccinia psidii MF-1]